MKPNFCLSLSFDGIRLMHRAADGWLLVGEVALDSPDLGRALGALRRDALALAPEGLRTKLLIPNDQIKYLAMDSARVNTDDVKAALDAATPYSLAELAYDISRGGGRTYAAAVARETLAEAEAFATEYRFAPVCFAAVPEPFTFRGEVFFGPTAAARAAGIGVDRDPESVVVVGRANLPETAGTSPAAASVVAAAASEPAPEPTPVVAAAPGPEPDLAVAPDPDPDPDSAPMAEDVVDDSAEESAEVPVFASRGRTLRADPPSTPPPPANPARVPVAPRITPVIVEPSRQDRMEPVFSRPAPPPAPPPPPLAVQVGPGVASPSLSGAARDGVAGRSTAAMPPLRTAPPDPVEAPRVTGMSEVAKPAGTVVSAALAVHDPARDDLTYQPDAAPSPAGPVAPVPMAAPQPATAPGPKSAASLHSGFAAAGAAAEATEPAGVTVFGARKNLSRASVGGKPRFLALILIAILLLFLAAVAAWAAFVSEDGLAGLFAPRNPVVAAGAVVVPVAIPGPAPEQAAPVPDMGDNAVALNASGNMATNVPEVGDEEDADIADAASAGTEATATATAFADAGGKVLTPAEAERLYAATGVWQRAPRLPLLPGEETADDIYVAAIDPEIRGQDAVELPAPALSAPDLALVAPPAPAAPGTVLDLDENGFVRATPEGTLTPGGVLVIAGKPPLLPQERPVTDPPATPPADPADPAAPAAEVVAGAADQPEILTAGGVALAAFRPSLRPEDLPEQIQQDGLTGRTISELVGLRPQVRPVGLAPAPEPEPAPEIVAAPEPAPAAAPAADVAAIAAAIAATAPQAVAPVAGATRLAVASSRRPDDRPRNFGRVVTRATQAASQAAARAPASTAAPAAPVPTASVVAPSGPVPGGVARAATVENAIDLHDVALIGVYGTPSNRSALVRTGNGRLLRVRVGERLDGGQVSAIGDNALNYVKRGRTLVLAMP